MQYIGFRIRKYKGIDDLSISLEDSNTRAPLCLLGLNESGKTTTLEAISLIGKLCGGVELHNGDLHDIRPKGTGFTGDIILSADLKLEAREQERVGNILNETSANKTLKIEFVFNFVNHSFQKSTITANTIIISHTEKWTHLAQYLQERIPDILYYEDFIFDIPSKISFNGKDASARGKTNIAWQNILHDIYQVSRENSSAEKEHDTRYDFKTDVVDWMTLDTNKGDYQTPRSRILGMENILDEVIAKKWKKTAQTTQSFSDIKIECHESNSKYNKFSIKVRSKNALYEIIERSKGFRWFFTFIILTEVRKYRKRETIFLLDEPASNLHPAAQELIYHALCQICDKASVIYTTHSPYLLDIENLKNTYLVINSADEFQDASITCQKALQLLDTLSDDNISTLHKKLDYIKPILDFICFEMPKILTYDIASVVDRYHKKLHNKDDVKRVVSEIEKDIQETVNSSPPDSKIKSIAQKIGEGALIKLIASLLLKIIGM